MALTAVAKASGSDTVARTSYAVTAFSVQAGEVVFAAVQQAHGTGLNETGAIRGWDTSQVWTVVSDETTFGRNDFGSGRTLVLWVCVTTAAQSAQLFCEFAQARNACLWSFFTVGGASLSQEIVQVGKADGTATSGLITLAAFGATANAAVGAWGHNANEVTTPGGGFTEIHDVQVTVPDLALQTELAVNDVTADASWTTSAPYGGVACEVRAALTSDLSESATLTDALALARAIAIAETASLAEIVEMLIGKLIAEGVTLVDTLALEKLLGAIVNETLALADAVTFLVAVAETGALTLTDSLRVVGAMPPDDQERWAPRWLVEIDW